MAHYHFRGRDARGAVVEGELEAVSELAVAEQLLRRGITPTAVTARQSRQRWTLALDGWLTPSIGLAEMVMFTRQMYALTRAGIPIMRAIHGLAETAHSKPLKAALQALETELGNGRPLSQAMQSHPRVFSALFIAIIHVGENTGRLEEAFLQLSNYFTFEMETRKRIQTALRYPMMVLMFLAGAMVILNLKVIPVFAGMFERFHVELPLTTRILLATSHFFVTWWWGMVATAVGDRLDVVGSLAIWRGALGGVATAHSDLWIDYPAFAAGPLRAQFCHDATGRCAIEPRAGAGLRGGR